MNRLLKFRVWDNQFSRWYTEPKELLWAQHGYAEPFDGTIAPYRADTELFCDPEAYNKYNRERFVLEQFTGLIDAKGHEVYEGDILWDGNSTTCPFDGKPMPSDDYPYSWWERAVVRYDNELARFVLYFYSPYGGEGYSGRDQHIDEYIRKGDYVAGNIHENPELLNPS